MEVVPRLSFALVPVEHVRDARKLEIAGGVYVNHFLSGLFADYKPSIFSRRSWHLRNAYLLSLRCSEPFLGGI